MRVGVEIRHIELRASGGIAPLLSGVLDALIAANPGHRFFVYGTIFNRGLVAADHPNVVIDTLPLDDAWSHLQRAFARDAVDVLFRGYPSVDTLRFPLHKQVFCIPDLQHDFYPEFFGAADLAHRREAFARALGGAGAIGTISEFARGTILASPQTACRDVFLMPPAGRRGADDGDTAALGARLDAIGPYFFYPANLWRHKNHLRLLEAFRRFRAESGRPMALVLTGHAEGWDAVAAQFPGLPLHHLAFVSDAEMRLLYRRATALAFFSLYEGFGMPLVEAFEAGCPVICSNTTSLPEVGGDAILSCDPNDAAAIARLMARIAGDEALRALLAARGRTRAGLYSWQRSARALMAALERVAGGPRARVRGEAPLVSIVTPSFNQGAFLRRTIDSVLAQTYPRIEYVVVDGASRDGSVDILEGYGGRFRWISEPDTGQANAINKGFAGCRGQIRAYLNSDDTLLPHAVERVVDFFDRHPGCDMVYGDANYIDSDDRIIGKYNTAIYSFERLMLDCCVCQPAAFWRDRIAEAVGGFDESLDIVLDYDYWLRIARAGGDIRFLPETLANSRLHYSTKTLSRRGDAYAEIFKTCLKHGGYISESYFEGYWHHRIHERDGALARCLRLVPRAPRLLARAHSAWSRLRHPPNGLRPAAEASTPPPAGGRRRAKPARPPRRPAIEGFWPDCWLAGSASFATPALARDGGLYVSGVPACDCTLRISVNGTVLRELELARDRFVEIALPSPGGGPLRLDFSSSTIDAANREIAFRLLGTNLFLERDC
jgi:glycosyltransferase involved in cell wall biosynthesis